MARISLIFPVGPGRRPAATSIGRYRGALEEQGHSVEVIVGAAPRPDEEPGGAGRSPSSRRAAACVSGIREATGHLLVILDPERDYSPEDVGRVVSALIRGEADIAVASRWTIRGVRGFRSLMAAGAGILVRPFLGTLDPWSGLVAVNRPAALGADESFAPVGSRFALELLARVEGRRVDIDVPRSPGSRRERFELDDIRHLKRLADDRFGNYSRLLQFCLVGASGMVVDLASYALFQLLLSGTRLANMTDPLVGQSMALATAGALAIALALAWNFTLNRRLTFNDALKGSIGRQFLTYALGNSLGIGLSFSLRLLLPKYVAFFHAHRLAAAVVGIVAATGISFSMSRWIVFGRRATDAGRGAPDEENAQVLTESVPAA